MTKTINIFDLKMDVTSEILEQIFSPYGNVRKAEVIKNRDTGASTGHGFIEMSTEEESTKAIKNLNGTQLHGKKMRLELKITPTRPKTK